MAGLAGAEDQAPRYSYSSYGTPGLIDMPTALSAPDAELATTYFGYGRDSRSTIAFQLTPRLTATFRYSGIEGLSSQNDILYDRSFDLQYRILDEGRIRPAVAVGLRDFIGTGVFSSEYVVATKTLSPRVSVTAGMGWGRLATRGGFSNPLGAIDSRFDTRPTGFTGNGGTVEAGRWFRGDAALFGGLAWQVRDDLQLKLEYSSDAYTQEVGVGTVTIDSPVNLGLDYRLNDSVSVQGFYLFGNTVGFAVNLINRPNQSVAPSGFHAAPFPVRARGEARDLGWVTDEPAREQRDTLLATAMKSEGLVLESMDIKARSVRVHVRNLRYQYSAEAIGRTARILSQLMPNSVEQFVIVPVVRGVPISAVTLRRSDIEAFEHAQDGAEQMLARAEITSAPREAPPPDFALSGTRAFTWGVAPYFRASFFDPDQPVRTDVGLIARADLQIAPGFYASGTFRQRLGGDIGDSNRVSNSVLPRVRSDAYLYSREGESALEKLTLNYVFRPGDDLYGRFSVGYLEPMFGGVSAELLWKPVDSPFAIGVEANWVKQRDFDQQFGFQDYSVGTGHVSGYWDIGNGFHGEVHAGRYLAGDWGATFVLDREFRNGWRIGAYATLTDVSFDDFGEGSFDKGLRFTVPISPLIGTPSRRKFVSTLQPLSRDGGARLNVDDRLYETVRQYHRGQLESSWGRFWR